VLFAWPSLETFHFPFFLLHFDNLHKETETEMIELMKRTRKSRSSTARAVVFLMTRQERLSGSKINRKGTALHHLFNLKKRGKFPLLLCVLCVRKEEN
jgi:hypothetical protein